MANEMTRWNPVAQMVAMQNAMDRLFDQSWRPYFTEEGRVGANLLALDIHETDKNYVVTTELPGVNPDNIQIKVDGDFLLIDAEIPEHEVSEGTRSLVKERRYGRYSRRMRLPQTVNFNKADANYTDGVLTLTLPKADEVLPKTIPVKAGTTVTANGTNGKNGNENK